MQAAQRRLNRWFAAILGMAVVALLARVYVTTMFFIPRIIRHHLADFAFPALITAVITSLVCLLTPRRVFRQGRRRTIRLWQSAYLLIAVGGMLYGMNIEREDYYGLDEEEGGFDPGALIDYLGIPNTDTFDWWDIVAMALGGTLVLYLQWRSVRHIRGWRWTPLLLERRPSPEDEARHSPATPDT